MKKLIIGGAKSGKSDFGLEFANNYAKHNNLNKIYLATAENLTTTQQLGKIDAEMRQKIALHKRSRDKLWHTIEEPMEITNVLEKLENANNLILLDCITMWLSNVILSTKVLDEKTIDFQRDKLTNYLKTTTVPITIITNEVGMSIVGASKLTRLFQLKQGQINKKLATIATEVNLIVAGCNLVIK